MALEDFTEVFESYDIILQVENQTNGEDKVFIVWYKDDEPQTNGEIWDKSGIADHAEWLYELLSDVEGMLANCTDHSDVQNFVRWAIDFGSPVEIPSYSGDAGRAENQYQSALEGMADKWDYLHEAYKELISIFGQDVYNELVEAAALP